jgi:hypothetical protein
MEYLERQEGPDGNTCELLTRVPYDRQRMIEQGLARARDNRDQMDACLRGLLWSCDVVDVLTGEKTQDIDRAGAEIVQPWRKRAVDIYNGWYAEAFPGPKGSSRTGSRTPRSGKTLERSEMSAPR